MNRRRFLLSSGATLVASPTSPRQASISITLDLEMSRNFPSWDQTDWDYQKGNLDAPTKKYAVEAARRVKKQGGIIHFFVVGQVFEQKDVNWLKEIAQTGHPIGNHTYDHVNVKAKRPQDLQYRFNRAPWLIEDKLPLDVIRENIRLTSAALKTRIGVDPVGFRTPGGFPNGLTDAPEVRQLLQDLGFWWVSSKYPAHPMSKPGEKPDDSVLNDLAKSLQNAQPSVYPGGLVEVPMSAPSDIVAFRSGKWKRTWFVDAVGQAVDHAISTGGVFDFLAHPSCLGVIDPGFETLDLICDRVKRAGERAKIQDLESIAKRYRPGNP